MRTVTIHAVHDRDVKEFWDSLGLPVKKECYVCGKEVTPANVGAFAPIEGMVEVCCESIRCLITIQEKQRLTR